MNSMKTGEAGGKDRLLMDSKNEEHDDCKE